MAKSAPMIWAKISCKIDDYLIENLFWLFACFSVLQVRQQMQKQRTGVVMIKSAQRVSMLNEMEMAPTI
jgi:hypothetical protein